MLLKEELVTKLQTCLENIAIDDAIKPEDMRPVAFMSDKRRRVADLEDELDRDIEALETDERLPPLLFRLANLHFNEQNLDRAILLYKKTLKTRTSMLQAWINLGISYYMKHDYQKALKSLETALRISSKNGEALAYAGLVKLEQDELDDSNDYFNRALELNPRNERALLGKGLLFRMKGNNVGAIAWFERALSANPRCSQIFLELARSYLAAHKLDKSIQVLKEGLRIDSSNPYILSLLGDISVEKGDYREAELFYERAVSMKFDDPELWMSKGDIHRKLNSNEEASVAYQKALNVNPELVKAWAKVAEVKTLEDDFEGALEYLNTALSLDQDNPKIAHDRGQLHLILGKHEQALSDFDQAFSFEPDNPEHLYFRAQTLEYLDRKSEAKRTWQVALDLYKEMGDKIRVAECSARIKKLPK